ncbi:GtrA family protein [Arthrobacter sp. SAFR-044]|uniref:GtrA family protein n=1 Tax=Arthrobacter sp. SAFR-044 TaxID=3387278 RepID=UPI003F7BDB5B
MLRRHSKIVLNSELARFIIVGGISFVIDLGLLMLLHEVFLVDLLIATPVAFLISLAFNYALQRVFTFRAENGKSVSFIKYCLLVAFNTVAVDVIVNFVDWLGAGYQIGKVIATILTTAWNFLLYKHWIFKSGAPDKTVAVDNIPAPPL